MKPLAFITILPLIANVATSQAQTISAEKVWQSHPWSVFLYRDADGMFDRCSTVIRYDDGTVMSLAIDRDAQLVMKIAPSSGGLGAAGTPVKGYLKIDNMQPMAFVGKTIKQGNGPLMVENNFEYNYRLFQNLRKGHVLSMSGDAGERSLSLKGSAKALRKTADCIPRPYAGGNSFESSVRLSDDRVVTATRVVASNDTTLYGMSGRTRFDCAFDVLMGTADADKPC